MSSNDAIFQYFDRMEGTWTHDAEGMADPAQGWQSSSGTEEWVWKQGELHGTTKLKDNNGGEHVISWQLKGVEKSGECKLTIDLPAGLPDWHYEGKLDKTGEVLTLSTSGPNPMAPGETLDYRTVLEWVDKDTRKVTDAVLQDDKWVEFYRGDLKRKALKK
jgi:hypothetical protein